MNDFLQAIRKKHFAGPGGISALLPIAIPMFISSMFDMLMMFVDRLFLARVGVVHQAATMTGGITSWMVVSFFVGIVSYSSALTAQYYGAKQRHVCVKMVSQALIIALASYPLVLGIDYLVSISPVFSMHSELEQMLEKRYFWYMAFGGIITLVRFAFASFFTGIGRTKILLYANIVALFVNIIANWVLIFGHFGFPALGLDGAAIGTLLSGASNCLLLVIIFFRVRRERRWDGESTGFVDRDKLWKLLRYGLPQGCENVLGMFCFTLLVSSFHSYGDDMAAATTIVFNWDGFSFHPLLGIQVAVSTLVGQAMGKDSPQIAQRAAHSGFKVSICYSLFMIFIFVTFTAQMVGIFTPDNAGLDYSIVREFAIPMLRLAGLYLMTDAILTTSVGVMRGAGDTFWCMIIHLCNQIIISAIICTAVYYLKLQPITVWIVFVICGMLSCATLFSRYKFGNWRTLRIIEEKKAGNDEK